MTWPRDISCCFRNLLSGMQPAIESSCQNSVADAGSIKHNPIYYFFCLPLGPAPAPVPVLPKGTQSLALPAGGSAARPGPGRARSFVGVAPAK